MSLPIRCKFPGTQFILGLLQFVFSLFQFSLHFEEKQVDGRIHHGRPQLGGARLLDLLEVLDLGLRDRTQRELVNLDVAWEMAEVEICGLQSLKHEFQEVENDFNDYKQETN